MIHPTIDAATQLRAKGVRAEDIERVALRVHPLVLELTGKKKRGTACKGNSASSTASRQGLSSTGRAKPNTMTRSCDAKT